MQNFNDYSNNPNSDAKQYDTDTLMQIIYHIMNMSKISQTHKNKHENKQKTSINPAYLQGLIRTGFQTRILKKREIKMKSLQVKHDNSFSLLKDDEDHDW